MIIVSPSTEAAVEPLVNPERVSRPLAWTLTAPWLGRSWDLTAGLGAVRKMRGATGLGQAPPEHWWSDSPMLDGSAWEGFRVGRGEVFLPLMVSADQDTFQVEHDALMDALDPAQEVLIRVTRPDGTWREVAGRYQSGADAPVNYDPMAVSRVFYGITWATGDPFWRGAPVEFRFPYPTDTPSFFTGPPFRLAPTEILGNATVTNPGDVAATWTCRVEGPFTSFSVGVGSSLVQMVLTKPAGGFVDIDMDPTRLTMTDEAGTDMWPYITDVAFESLPPGVTSVVTTLAGAAGGSAVSGGFTPRYRRGF